MQLDGIHCVVGTLIHTLWGYKIMLYGHFITATFRDDMAKAIHADFDHLLG